MVLLAFTRCFNAALAADLVIATSTADALPGLSIMPPLARIAVQFKVAHYACASVG